MNIENQYLNLLENILDNGQWKENRTGIRCKTLSGVTLVHDMSQGFPLLSHRRLPIRSTLVELEGFLNGITSKEWYAKRGCNYWLKWANPVKVQQRYSEQLQEEPLAFELKEHYIKQHQLDEDDLGPLGYSWQFRKFNKHYGDYDGDLIYNRLNGDRNGFDQLLRICESLKTNPNDRRMIVSYWNPLQEHMMGLPPCHIGFQLNHINGVLHLNYTQRSVDTVCNQTIVTYAALLLLFCKFSGFKPGNLTAEWHDVHIYENHLDGVAEILARKNHINPLPTLEITHSEPFSINDDGVLIVNWTHKDYKLNDYRPLDPIKFEVAV